MVHSLLWITFHAEKEGDRDQVLKIVKGWYLGVIQPEKESRPQKFVCKICLMNDRDPEYIRDTMISLGVFLLEISSAEKVHWRNRKYDPHNFPPGDKTVCSRRKKQNKKTKKKG